MQLGEFLISTTKKKIKIATAAAAANELDSQKKEKTFVHNAFNDLKAITQRSLGIFTYSEL